MKVIFTISNPPTKEFINTRHNIGRIFATNHLLKKYKFIYHDSKYYQEYQLNNSNKTILCLSKTYMNLSGQAVSQFFKKYNNLTKRDLVVVHDDLQHKFGNVRIKKEGSSEGHNGISSIIGSLGGKDFKRLQLGIDRPDSRDPEAVANYVLKNFNANQQQKLSDMFNRAQQLLKKQQFL